MSCPGETRNARREKRKKQKEKDERLEQVLPFFSLAHLI
jgi:hypothetical protein